VFHQLEKKFARTHLAAFESITPPEGPPIVAV